jgi:hypothetical protein
VTGAQQLLDAFERERWKSNPYERMLDIAHHDTAELLELVLQSIDRLEKSATFIDGALSFLDEPQFDVAVEHAVRHLNNRPERDTGDSVAELHRLLALTDVPRGLRVTTRSRLELATCLSCLGWSGPWLFYAHGDDGVPQPTETQRTRSVPEFPSGPLAEADIGLVPTPSRWLYQDWALSNGRENLNRLGGEPTWIQDADYPSCPGCGHPMDGLMQLDSDLATDDEGEFLWGSGGIGYVVWCDRCAISGVTAQWT